MSPRGCPTCFSFSSPCEATSSPGGSEPHGRLGWKSWREVWSIGRRMGNSGAPGGRFQAYLRLLTNENLEARREGQLRTIAYSGLHGGLGVHFSLRRCFGDDTFQRRRHRIDELFGPFAEAMPLREIRGIVVGEPGDSRIIL